jgi:hypothetical protein
MAIHTKPGRTAGQTTSSIQREPLRFRSSGTPAFLLEQAAPSGVARKKI